MRGALGGKRGLGLSDLAISWYCLWCTIAQQAREADKALNAETTGYCAIHYYGTSDPIGSTIRVENPQGAAMGGPQDAPQGPVV